MYKILVLTPFRNESHSFHLYLESLLAVDYPKHLIDVFWLENDSSDETLDLLCAAHGDMPFNHVDIHSIKIHGPVGKGLRGNYRKQAPQAPGRVAKTWMTIWNDYFLPLVKESGVDYVLTWFADVVAPPNVVTEYLKVFEEYPDAGWVGGRCHRRYPRHGELCSPATDVTYRRGTRHGRLPKERKVTPVIITSHCWMNPRDVLAQTRMYRIPREMHLSLTHKIRELGRKVYFQPSVYLKHVSTDGKIHQHGVGGHEGL